MFKKLLLTAMSMFLAFRSYELINPLFLNETKSFSISENLFIAFLINLFVTGVYAFAGFAWPTYTLLPNSWYSINKPVLTSRIYALLKVDWFKKLLILFFWGHKKNKTQFFSGKKSGLKNLIAQTKRAEFGPLAAFISIGSISLFLLINGYTTLCAFTFIPNFIGNFYPIVLQRTHRIRIEKLILKIEKVA